MELLLGMSTYGILMRFWAFNIAILKELSYLFIVIVCAGIIRRFACLFVRIKCKILFRLSNPHDHKKVSTASALIYLLVTYTGTLLNLTVSTTHQRGAHVCRIYYIKPVRISSKLYCYGLLNSPSGGCRGIRR